MWTTKSLKAEVLSFLMELADRKLLGTTLKGGGGGLAEGLHIYTGRKAVGMAGSLYCVAAADDSCAL